MALRSSVIAEKIGMSSLFLKNEVRIPITLMKISGCVVVSSRNCNDQFFLQVGQGDIKTKNVTLPLLGHFKKNQVVARRKLMEFKVSEECVLPVGAEFLPSHFDIGSFVDVSGVTIGRGFAGPMKRHNFAGLRASHGVSVSHRSHGSTGNRKSPAKVFKNKKMAGHMGCQNVTAQNLEVVFIDDTNGILGIKGCVPGYSGSFVVIKDCIKIPSNKLDSVYKMTDKVSYDQFFNKNSESIETNNIVIDNNTNTEDNNGGIQQ